MGNQAYATLRDLDDLGVSPPALATLPVARKLKALLAGSGELATYLRPRHKLPLRPWIEAADASGLTAGATATQSGAGWVVADLVIRFPLAGVVGVAGLTYELSRDAGDNFAAALPLPLSGALVIDGITTVFAGAIEAADLFAYSTVLDAALRGHAVAIASWKLLHNRGLDPEVAQDLKELRDAAIEWAKDIGTGTAHLDGAIDSTPDKSECGPLFCGDTNSWDWLDDGGEA